MVWKRARRPTKTPQMSVFFHKPLIKSKHVVTCGRIQTSITKFPESSRVSRFPTPTRSVNIERFQPPPPQSTAKDVWVVHNARGAPTTLDSAGWVGLGRDRQREKVWPRSGSPDYDARRRATDAAVPPIPRSRPWKRSTPRPSRPSRPAIDLHPPRSERQTYYLRPSANKELMDRFCFCLRPGSCRCL